MSLFERKQFKSHSGLLLNYKIDCDALSDEDIQTCAKIISDSFGKYKIEFHGVVGVPRGGLRLQEALSQYVTQSDATTLLIVDDVWTTGRSMEEMRKQQSEILKPDGTPLWTRIWGAVIFDRSFDGTARTAWVTPIFQLRMF